ncbi:hypothetical protein D3C87_1803930 [compost metagenome]
MFSTQNLLNARSEQIFQVLNRIIYIFFIITRYIQILQQLYRKALTISSNHGHRKNGFLSETIIILNVQ